MVNHMSNIFISYSHEDEEWKNRVVKHLVVLDQEGLDLWDDRRIAVGDDWHSKIEQAIQDCDVALLLVSANFMTSEFIRKKEIPMLLQRREKEGVRIIPVILKPCAWDRVPWINGIQARPKDGVPLSTVSDGEADAALASLSKEILDLCQPNDSDVSNAQIVISVMGTHGGCGKSTFINFTAQILADSGAGVVIVDFDLGNSWIHQARPAVVSPYQGSTR